MSDLCSTKSALRLSLSDSWRRRYPWRVRIFLWLIFSAQAFGAGLDHYAQLVVNDSRATPRDGVRVTYLGTNGYQFEFKGHSLLIDPYFSRVDLLSVALGSRIQPNASRINDGLNHLASGSCRTDAILVTHGHFDHLLDVPTVMAKTGARLVASASSVDLARRAGASSGEAVKPGDVRRIGPWKIRVLSATHDRLFGKVPFDRPPSQAGYRRSVGEGGAAATRGRLDLRGTACVFDRGERPAHLHRLRRHTGQLPPNERVDLQSLAWHCRIRGRDCTPLSSASIRDTFCRVIRTIFPAVERRISIRPTDRFPFCGTRLCGAESQSLNSAGLF